MHTDKHQYNCFVFSDGGVLTKYPAHVCTLYAQLLHVTQNARAQVNGDALGSCADIHVVFAVSLYTFRGVTRGRPAVSLYTFRGVDMLGTASDMATTRVHT